MAEEQKTVQELEKMEFEEILPVEKKLVIWSIILGIILLFVLVFVSYKFFPAPH